MSDILTDLWEFTHDSQPPNTEVKRKPIPKSVRKKVWEKYNGHCAYCGCDLEYKEMQVDHVVSRYWYDGADDISNYMPACRQCNFYKSTLSLEDFRKRLQTITDRLKNEFIYKVALKYGLVEEHNEPIKFYFEEVINETNII